MLWAPRAPRAPSALEPKEIFGSHPIHGPNDNTLIAQLTTEQWTFGPTLGDVLSRGFRDQANITVTGLTYLQTVQNVTNTDKGDGSRLSSTFGSGLKFEPGMFLYVPAANHDRVEGIVRMASIPHGTTINAQGPVPAKNTDTDSGGVKGKPKFDNFVLNTKPCSMQDPTKQRVTVLDKALDLTKKKPFREPDNLSLFGASGTITKEIIMNPNIVLANATGGLNVVEHITLLKS
ncbi:hypothetical protein OQA88_338 [Cercophora sp. LCS_1]